MSTDTLVQRAINFSAGPAVLPLSVLEKIKEEMLCLPDVGSSILEISHRGNAFKAILHDAQQAVRDLLDVPDDYEIVFVQGGATLQNVMVPANFLTGKDQTADYIITGSWGKKSSAEVSRFGKLNVAWNGSSEGFNRLPKTDELRLTDDAAYVHVTSNETIQGVQFAAAPDVDNRPLVADQSSELLSRPVNIRDYGLIYACAQKNSGIAGVTVCIIRNDLLERCTDRLPTYLNFKKHVEEDSMLNTPPTFAIYVMGLVCHWLKDEIGGLQRMAEINAEKSSMLYDLIDASNGFYIGHANASDRSQMNVVFRTTSPDLDARFLSEAESNGMTSLKGHRSLGGIRASIYNAMPIEGVKKLADFMRDFSEKNG